jgi:thiosulfate/3-mercaptopyruvate sulfurtransferase
MPDYPQEGTLRRGHIPTAINIPWATAVNEIGERSAHTWFVLKYLLNYPKVKNYDGSWTEWGNSVKVPIVKGEYSRNLEI